MATRFAWRFSFAVLAGLVLAPPSFAAPSDLDRTFGTFGRAFPTFPASIGSVRALVPLSGGRMLGVTSGGVRHGGFYASLFRITRNGTLDPAFGSRGAVSFSDATSTGSAAAQAIVRQSDGGLVVLGGNPLGRPHFALARFAPDGTLDGAFGSGGKVESDAVDPVALAVQADGALIVAVSTCSESGACRFALLRYSAAGVLDRGFGGDGAVRVALSGAHSVVVQRDGRIVVAGVTADAKLALVAYRPDGSPDPGFAAGGAGLSELAPGLIPVSDGLVTQSDGKVIVAARDTRTLATRSWVLRYRRDGSLDRPFGVEGAARIDGMALTALARQPNGKLVGVGGADPTAIAIVRLRADGDRDRGFGRRGRMLTDLDAEYNIDQAALAIAIGPESRLTVGGGIGFPDHRPVLVRYQGGPSVVGGAVAKGRYVVRVSRAGGRRGALHRGDLVNVRLEDRRGRTQRYDLCFIGPPLARSSCSEDRRTGRTVSRTLAQAGRWTLRFRIQATGEVILHTLRVYAPSRSSQRAS